MSSVIKPQSFDYVRFIGNAKYVCVKRSFGEALRGYVLAANDQLVLMRQFDGFTPAGFVALHLRDVQQLAVDQKWTEMIASEGFAPLALVKPNVRVGSIHELLLSLFELGRNIKIECENCAESEEAGLHIGRITAISTDALSFAYFESDGCWASIDYQIPLSSMTKVTFNDPYVDTFSKYVGECPLSGNRT